MINWSDIFFREYHLETEDNVWGYKKPIELSFPIFKQGDSRESTENLN